MSSKGEPIANQKISSIPKDFRPYVKKAIDQGWMFVVANHSKLVPPEDLDGAHKIMISCSPSDLHAFNQFRRELKRCGVKI